jgi:dsDNA-specific endonuclease/ATPase MutS2
MTEDELNTNGDPDADETVALPIDGTLDLHTFHPRDVKQLVPDYIEECRSRGIFQVRIVHGKGTGALRRTVHAVLDKHPDVVEYRLGGSGGGEWGATIVVLRT